MEEEDLSYKAEYAKSNRASCKGCSSLIAKDSLRLAHLVQSRHFDGKQPHWFHYSCFFGKFRPTSVDEVGDYHDLRWEDQEKIRTQIERGPSKKNGAGAPLVSKSLKDFVIQYALSGRAKCRKCDGKIEKDEIRISHKEVHPEKPQLGFVDRWHHVGCFVKRRKEFGWIDGGYTADMISGFKAIDPEDRKTITKLLDKKGKKSQKSKENESPGCSIKQEASPPLTDDQTKKLKHQSSLLWKVIDTLKHIDLKKNDFIEILEHNQQEVPKGLDKIYERIADGMLFGTLSPCAQCGGQLVASSRGFYQCHGNISEWTKCTNTTLDVKRDEWVIPNNLKEECPYLAKYKFKPQDRIFPPLPPVKPLKNKKIVILGKVTSSKEDLKANIEKLGGSVTTSLSKAYCCISTKGDVDAGKKRMKEAEVNDLFIVSEEFLKECDAMKTPPPSLIPLLKKFSLASWGSERETTVDGKSMKRTMEEESEGGESSKKLKLVVKHGAAVDPESGLENSCDVTTIKGKKYTATLSLVDMKSGANSYYKLQLLTKHSGKSWCVFRSWGRVGTVIGGTKVETFRSLESAMNNFLEVYLDKTGNSFLTKNFQKYPNKFFPLDIDYGEDNEKIKGLQDAGSKSKLEPPVQDLIKMIFDIESMKKAMVEFELDLNKMPLGKLSKKQMQRAYSVLTEATELINDNELVGSKMLDCSNRFYTLIPHDYGMQQPPKLDNADIIKAKTAMLDNLMDIEVAYNLLKTEGEDENAEDPLDVSYKKLQCDLEVVSKDSDEYKMVEKYAQLTHASTHTQYSLKIEELFKINRHGEVSRFRPFKSLHNRKLLWHGSRTTNYAGILSQGLRIAPPEAPVTGYMFGKGIYFADMVSKSTNYCGTRADNPHGLAMLADVALGNMYELVNAKNVRKLPKSKHSVKGVGSTTPDKSTYTTHDGAEVPMGKGAQTDLTDFKDGTSLLYNEYIVYDVAQVNLKYLVKFKFQYDSLW
uniref:Poly [ADP-ribose] polymerase n=1 Tax=Phallusia mammillata TaxID=59560 RepID=A0A6F9DN94_9ASCI|nr:poly [ADP-ribose] polymerase 1 [Phallusia mammillata]